MRTLDPAPSIGRPDGHDYESKDHLEVVGRSAQSKRSLETHPQPGPSRLPRLI